MRLTAAQRVAVIPRMFTIIGGDGSEYGPVPASQVRTWMAAGRANLQTKAKKIDEDTWKTLGDFPEFSPEAAPAPPPLPGDNAAAHSPSAAADPKAIADEMLARAAKLSISGCLSRGWDLWMKHFGRFLLAYLVFILISAALAFVPLGSLIFGGVLTAGLFHYTLKLLHEEEAVLSDLFAGFSEALGPLILAGIVVALLGVLGLFCLILPGIYLLVAWQFTYPLVLEKKLPFWTAMEVSRRVITHNWWRMFLLMIVAGLLSLLGLAVLVVGIILTLPISMCALACAYDSLCDAKK